MGIEISEGEAGVVSTGQLHANQQRVFANQQRVLNRIKS